MTKPLALLLYERVLPGSQLVNRFEDLGYRVQTISDAAELVILSENERPMVVVADVVSSKTDVAAELVRLRQNEATSHIPVIAFGPEGTTQIQAAQHTLMANEAAVLNYLPQLLEQALRID